MIEIAVVIGGLIIIIYLFYKDYKKDRDFNNQISSIQSKVYKILCSYQPDGHKRPFYFDDAFFINNDARGYALKLKSEFIKDKTIHRDWGGYGIIAPDFREGV